MNMTIPKSEPECTQWFWKMINEVNIESSSHVVQLTTQFVFCNVQLTMQSMSAGRILYFWYFKMILRQQGPRSCSRPYSKMQSRRHMKHNVLSLSVQLCIPCWSDSLSRGFSMYFCFLLIYPRGSGWWLKCMGPCHPRRKPEDVVQAIHLADALGLDC